MEIPPIKVYFSERDKREILKEIKKILDNGQLTFGRYGEEFEKKFAKYIGTKYAVAVSSGTCSMEISLRCFDIKGSSVIVPTNTFFATPASVLHAGGKVKFIDMDPKTFSITHDDVKEAIDENTKAVMIVHIGGIITPEIKKIKRTCMENGLFFLEDAAHAHGSSLNGEKAGTFGDASSFSFYPTKLITSAEGGMILTNDNELRKRAIIFRDQGKIAYQRNIHTELGYNWRMSELHAILGLHQLNHLEDFINRKKKIARIYDESLEEIDGATPLSMPKGLRCNFYKYIVLLDRGINRTKLKEKMKNKFNINLSGEVYELPCHLQPIFKKECGYKEGDLPVSEDICSRHICLPIYPTMKREEIDYVVDSLKRALGNR